MKNTYRIKGILFSILSLSGPLSGKPDRVIQMMVLIKTVSKTNQYCVPIGFENLTFTSLLYNNLLDNVDKLIN
jgi:hypothetical protein